MVEKGVVTTEDVRLLFAHVGVAVSELAVFAQEGLDGNREEQVKALAGVQDALIKLLAQLKVFDG